MSVCLSSNNFHPDLATKCHRGTRERGECNGRIVLVEDPGDRGPAGSQRSSKLRHADVATLHLPRECCGNDLLKGSSLHFFVDAFFAKEIIEVTSDVRIVFGLQVFSFWLNRVRDLASCVSF